MDIYFYLRWQGETTCSQKCNLTANIDVERIQGKRLQEFKKAKSHAGEDVTVFSSSEISVCISDTTAVCNGAEGTKSSESSFKRKQQPSDTKQPNEMAISSADLVFINSAFEPDETSQKYAQVGVMSVWAYAEWKIRKTVT